MTNAYVLFKNGSVKKTEIDRKTKLKTNEIKCILVECFHPVFGFFYVAQRPRKFMQRFKAASRAVVSYRFLDGILVDEEDSEYLFVKNRYFYTNPQDVLSKIMEICINEYIFNDAFWIYDSFFQYIYDNVKVKLKGRKHKKSISGARFREIYIGNKSIFDKDVIQMSDKKWKTSSIEKAKDECFLQLYTNIYFKVDSRLFTLGKYHMTSDIILVHDDFVLNSRDTDGKLNKVGCLQSILETYVSKYIIRKLECYEEGDTYSVKTRVKFKNKKISRKKWKFGKFVRKFFIEIEKF